MNDKKDKNEQVKQPIDFNVNNPTIENIDYVFSKLLFNLISACLYEKYADSKLEYKELLEKIEEWLGMYVNKRDLSQINPDELLDVYYRLMDLKNKYLIEDEWYAERADHWYWCLMLLRKSQIENGGIK